MKLEDFQVRKIDQIVEVLSEMTKTLEQLAQSPQVDAGEFDRIYIRYKNLEQHWKTLFDSMPK
jgi:ssDNA-specific exonuclease RecJ